MRQRKLTVSSLMANAERDDSTLRRLFEKYNLNQYTSVEEIEKMLLAEIGFVDKALVKRLMEMAKGRRLLEHEEAQIAAHFDEKLKNIRKTKEANRAKEADDIRLEKERLEKFRRTANHLIDGLSRHAAAKLDQTNGAFGSAIHTELGEIEKGSADIRQQENRLSAERLIVPSVEAVLRKYQDSQHWLVREYMSHNEHLPPSLPKAVISVFRLGHALLNEMFPFFGYFSILRHAEADLNN